ncbi:MAG: HAMP domain-containing histidine kinase [Bdellovibrionales bacterium]|nr:HAMP domain-containing histidine kinase [Bdellovibrionales bacterium]
MENQIYSLIGSINVSENEIETSNDIFLQADFFDDQHRRYAYVLDEGDQVLWASSKVYNQLILSSDIDVNRWEFFRDRSSPDYSFVLAHKVSWVLPSGQDKQLVMVIYESPTSFASKLRSFRQRLWIFLLIMAGLIVIIQMILIQWGLRPLAKISNQLELVRSGEQNNIEGQYTYELDQVRQSINEFIAQEQIQFQQLTQSMRNLSHSVKTPLAILKTLLDNEASIADQRKIYLQQLHSIESTTQYYLNQAQLERSRVFTPPISIVPELQRMITSISKLSPQKEIMLSVDSSMDPKVRMSRDEIYECFGNLIENAQKYSRSKVTLSIRIQASDLLIYIDDDGPGIDAGIREKIFERGYRVDENIEGQGLGLSISKQIIEKARGQINVETSPFGGCRIRVVLQKIEH